MSVPPHPHTGLQTVSWLFTGEIEHRDSAGHHAVVRPGEVNLMTAGRGISHSEVSTAGTSTLHGAQLWVALPDDARLILIGGEPFGEQIVMWWNFVGRTHEDIVAYRTAWQAEAIGSGEVDAHAPRFISTHGDPGTRDGHGYTGSALPAPALPTVRLLPRRR